MKTISLFKNLLATATLAFCLAPVSASSQEKMSNAKFLQEASIMGSNEVAMGNLGQKRLQNPEVKAYAQMVLNTHMASNAKLKALAKKKKVKLPDPMTIPINSMQTRADTTKKDTSVKDSLVMDFDAEYVQMMIDDHNKAIELFELGSASGDKDIRMYASKNLAVLRKHLSEAQKLAKGK